MENLLKQVLSEIQDIETLQQETNKKLLTNWMRFVVL